MKSQRETVVVIHGLGGKRLWMAPLSYRLARQFDVANWSYSSYGGSIDTHAVRFSEFIESFGSQQKVNIVAHSLGSIVTRAALQKVSTSTLASVSRVVMLAPPNTGSNVAKFVSPVVGSMCKTIKQISSHKNSYVNQLPNKNTCETGVIASRFDMLVPVKNTMMENLADHQTVFGTHNSLLFSSKVAAMAARFIQKGKFAA